MGLKSYFNCFLFFIFSLIIMGCVTNGPEVDHEGDASKSFAEIKRLYENEVYDKAIELALKFKTKHTYSNYFGELDLIVAESYLKKGDYLEAAAGFKRFVQFYPKHPRRPYAYFKIGDTYWQQAPTAIDQEQSFAEKAIESWQELLRLYPESTLSEKVRKLIKEGELRLLKSHQFVTNFYCKQGIWHACAYRGLMAIKKSDNHKEIKKELLEKSAYAFGKMAQLKSENKADKETNLYFRDMTLEQLKKKSEDLHKKADEIKM